MARIAPLPRKEWPPEMREALAAMIPPVPRHPRPPTEDRPARHGAARHVRPPHRAGQGLLHLQRPPPVGDLTSPAPARDPRPAGRGEAPGCFLWAQHVFEAKDSGLSDEEMSRIAFGPDAPYFEPLGAMVRAVDELIDPGAISDRGPGLSWRRTWTRSNCSTSSSPSAATRPPRGCSARWARARPPSPSCWRGTSVRRDRS